MWCSGPPQSVRRSRKTFPSLADRMHSGLPHKTTMQHRHSRRQGVCQDFRPDTPAPWRQRAVRTAGNPPCDRGYHAAQIAAQKLCLRRLTGPSVPSNTINFPLIFASFPDSHVPKTAAASSYGQYASAPCRAGKTTLSRASPEFRRTLHSPGKYIQTAAKSAQQPCSSGRTIFRHPKLLLGCTQTHEHHISTTAGNFSGYRITLSEVTVVNAGNLPRDIEPPVAARPSPPPRLRSQ